MAAEIGKIASTRGEIKKRLTVCKILVWQGFPESLAEYQKPSKYCIILTTKTSRNDSSNETGQSAEKFSKKTGKVVLNRESLR